MLGAVVAAAAVPSPRGRRSSRVGIVFVPISVLGALVYIATDAQASERAPRPTLTRRDRSRDTAMELAKQAGAPLAAADCAEVRRSIRASAISTPSIHDACSCATSAIQRCLAP